MKLKLLGFFRELTHGIPNGQSLEDAIRPSPLYPKSKVATYLRTAPLLVASPGLVRDAIDEDNPIIGPAHIRTDGVWAWPQDLAHYTAKYNIELDVDFLEHLETRDYNPPKEGELSLTELEL